MIKDAYSRALIFWLPGSLVIGYTLLGRPGLPDKYKIDSDYIANVAGQDIESQGAFDLVGRLYRLLGLESDQTLAALATIFVFYLVFGYVFLKFAPMRLSVLQVILVVFAHFFGAVFMAQMTKEILMLIVPISAFIPILKKIPMAWKILVVSIVIGLFFRNYWLLTAFFYIVFSALFRIPSHYFKLNRLIALVSVYLVISNVYEIYFGIQLQDIRTGLNQFRIGSENAVTQISYVLDGSNPTISSFNMAVTLFFLIVPLPLLLQGPIYWIFAAAIFTFWFAVFRAIWKNVGSNYDLIWSQSTRLLVAFLATQSIFEPDYGSYLRHLAPLAPLALVVVFGGNHEKCIDTKSDGRAKN